MQQSWGFSFPGGFPPKWTEPAWTSQELRWTLHFCRLGDGSPEKYADCLYCCLQLWLTLHLGDGQIWRFRWFEHSNPGQNPGCIERDLCGSRFPRVPWSKHSGPLWRIVDNPEILAMHIGNSACPYTMCGSDKWFVLYIYIYPIGSMYGIHANIWGILMVNATIYSIHGSYG